MKTFATLLFLAPAFVLASPAQNEIRTLESGALEVPNPRIIGDVIAAFENLVESVAQNTAQDIPCCKEVPCMIGCAVDGKARVSFPEHKQASDILIRLSILVLLSPDVAMDSHGCYLDVRLPQYIWNKFNYQDRVVVTSHLLNASVATNQ
jgi:hypothetical protein